VIDIYAAGGREPGRTNHTEVFLSPVSSWPQLKRLISSLFWRHWPMKLFSPILGFLIRLN